MSAKKHPILKPVISILFALALAIGAGLAIPLSAYAAEPTLVATKDTEQAKIELYLVSGDPKVAGQTVEYRVKLTNKTAKAVSLESVNYNLANADGCKWRNAAANTVQECYIAGIAKKLTHVVSQAEATAGGFVPYITFRMYSEVEYGGEKTSLGGINENKIPSTLTVTNPKPAGQKWTLGERINFKATLINHTGKARALSAKSSNLDNWEGCKWSNMPVNKEMDCTAPYHVVTEADVKAGKFTPEIVWQYYPNAKYEGTATYYATTEAEALPVASNYLKLDKFELAPESQKAHYQVGDVLKFAVEVSANGDDALTVAPVTDTAVTNLTDSTTSSCERESLAVGTVHRCQLTYTITEADLTRGEVEAKLAIDGKMGQQLLNRVTATTFVYTQKQYPQADRGTKAKDADPAAEAKISNPQIIATSSKQANIRIPAIAVAPNGDLLASYDYRPKNGRMNGGDSPNENSIMQRRSTDNGKTWQPETVIARGIVGSNIAAPRGYSDPSYVVDHESGTIFNFHVYSQVSGVFAKNPAYTFTPDGKIDETSEHAMNLGLSVSTDNGHSWTQRVITDQVLGEKARELQSCFATSGAGTQKMTAPNKGRLLQQMACVPKSGGIVAYTIYSDDHGKTWKSGNPTPAVVAGKKFDENKVTELSDGSLILISRSQAGGGRIICSSIDSGENWKDCHVSNDLADENNNAQVIRAFPNAKPGTLRSQVLLFSGTDNGRKNGYVWVSFDDGKTWPVKKQFKTGGTGYTTMTVQKDGNIGLLMEPNGGGWADIAHLSFNLRWLEDDFRTELKGKDAAASGQIGKEITPISVTDLFECNDPVLADTFEVTGLPEGLVFDKETGQISGTPVGKLEADKDYELTVSLKEAEDGTGYPRAAQAKLALKISPRDAATPAPTPQISPIADQTVTADSMITPIKLEVKDGAIGAVTGLPEGVSFDAATATILGTPKKAGSYEVTVTALNVDGEEKATTTFTITVEEATPTPGGDPEPGTNPDPGTDPGTTPDPGTSPGDSTQQPGQSGKDHKNLKPQARGKAANQKAQTATPQRKGLARTGANMGAELLAVSLLMCGLGIATLQRRRRG